MNNTIFLITILIVQIIHMLTTQRPSTIDHPDYDSEVPQFTAQPTMKLAVVEKNTIVFDTTHPIYKLYGRTSPPKTVIQCQEELLYPQDKPAIQQKEKPKKIPESSNLTKFIT